MEIRPNSGIAPRIHRSLYVAMQALRGFAQASSQVVFVCTSQSPRCYHCSLTLKARFEREFAPAHLRRSLLDDVVRISRFLFTELATIRVAKSSSWFAFGFIAALRSCWRAQCSTRRVLEFMATAPNNVAEGTASRPKRSRDDNEDEDMASSKSSSRACTHISMAKR